MNMFLIRKFERNEFMSYERNTGYNVFLVQIGVATGVPYNLFSVSRCRVFYSFILLVKCRETFSVDV